MFNRFVIRIVFFCLLISSSVLAQTSNTQWLPIVASGGGFVTEINLVNITDEPQTVNISSFTTSGQPMDILADGQQANSSMELIVAAAGNGVINTIVGDEQLQPGWARIDGNIQVNTTLLIGDTNGGAVPNRMQFPTPIPTQKLVFTAQSGAGRDTSMAIMSPPDNAGNSIITLTAIDLEGEMLETATLQMQPGRMGFVGLDNLMPGLAEFDGTLEIRSSFPIVVQPFREDGELISSLRLFAPRPDPVFSNACGSFSDWETSDYVLPYPPGAAYEVNQGNCSGFGHNGIFLNGYDFIMNIGTPVSAARDGVVQHTNENIPDGNRAGTNLIIIRHDDGTTALYSHLTINGALVEPGQAVRAGDVIGLSGDTGNTGGLPHLHFSVHVCGSLPGLAGSINCPSIPITFRNTQPNTFGLNPRVSYTADEF